MKPAAWLGMVLVCWMLVGLGDDSATARSALPQPTEPPGFQVLEVRRIWSEGKHNGFPDLIRYKGRWYCVFREASGHVSPDGILRVIASEDGLQWESVREIAQRSMDMREGYFALAPDDRLLLTYVGCAINPDGSRGLHTNYAVFFDGQSWSDPRALSLAGDNVWLNRPVWHDGRFYAMSSVGSWPDFTTRLWTSTNGLDWETHVQDMFTEAAPNEAGLLVLEDGRMMCLQRRDQPPFSAQLGLAKPPYKEWTWTDLGLRIGRPTMLRLPDGRILAPMRLLNPMRTTLSRIDPQAGTLTEALKLPSGGDGGYTGAVLHEDGCLWIAYYSSHEDRKSSIYLAKVRIGPEAGR